MAVNIRELLRSAQSAEIAGERMRARELLERAAASYEHEGNTGRAEQLRRHAQRLGESDGGDGVAESDASPGDADRELPERAPKLAATDDAAWCSFCCRPRREVGALVQAPVDAFICQGCLQRANALLAGDRREPTPAAPSVVELPRREHPLDSQRSVFEALGARLRRGPVRALLLGPAGCGKSSLLRAWADEGLGELITARRLLRTTAPVTRALLVDEGESLTPEESGTLAQRLGHSFVLAVRGVGPVAGKLASPLFASPLFTTEELVHATGGHLPAEALENVESLHALPGLRRSNLLELAQRLGVDGLSEDQLEALAQAAEQSPRGGHELKALLARARS